MAWLDGGVLSCDTCPATMSYPTSTVNLEQMARARGWHCWTGPSLTGKDIETALCPDCIGTARTKLPKATPLLEPQDPLF